MGEEVFPWLKSLPLAPEYHPTLIEFQDPISYIFKIEEEASKYGICKIVPPVSASSKKTIIANLNQSLSSRNPDSSPTFTTRQQQIGFCPRKHLRPVQRSVWQSGENYTFPQFELKAKNFEKNYLKKGSNSKKGLTALEVETLYWKAQVDKPFSVEYANDMPGSAFDQTGGGCGRIKQGKEIDDVMTVGESQWNMGRVSRAKGSLLKFLKEEIPGVSSPMVYIGMLFSWFAWHCEDHDFHSLNYMHMGAGKTWYGVPRDAAVAFEDVIRTHAYGGEISPIVTFTTLGEKTTIMSPEVLLKAGVPCCRLVQNAGEFVVTFPRAYHSGFSHGFNCAEAANIATPGWLKVAREAAIRRVSIDCSPMVSHYQLLYDLALSLSTSVPTSSRPKPRSSRLKNRLKMEGEAFIRKVFVEDMIQNNKLLNILGNGSPVTVLSEDSLNGFLNSLDSSIGSRSDTSLTLDSVVVGRRPIRRKFFSFGVKKADMATVFSCITCGTPCYACVAIVQPTQSAASYLMSADLSTTIEDANVVGPESSSGQIQKSNSEIGGQIDSSALALLSLAYGDSSDSEQENDVQRGIYVNYSSDQTDSKSNKFVMESNCSMGQFEFLINGPINSACDKDFSRIHIFCLEHAREVELRLQSVGGVHMLLLCHQDYPEINGAARLVGRELGIPDEKWTDVGFIKINEQDKIMIKSALDNEELTNGNRDWAVKLGIDIFYSAKLGGSPFYKKQMPYNSVIYNAFDQYSPSNDVMTPKQSSRQKKVTVAGRWCGKVWMSNQVHPLLVVRDDEQENETFYSVFPKKNLNYETQSVVSKNVRKRKRTVKGKFLKVESSTPPLLPMGLPVNGGFRRQKICKARNVIDKKERESDMESREESEEGPARWLRRRITGQLAREFEVELVTKPKKNQNLAKKGKKARVIEISDDDREFGCDIEGCNMSFESKQELKVHKKNICTVTGCEKKFFSHKYLVQHRRVHMDDRPLKCPWKGCEMAFKWAWARTEHFRVHTGARPYVCTEVGCGQTFRFVSDFSRHKRKTGHVKKQVRE